MAAPPAADSGDADEDFELFGDEDDDEASKHQTDLTAVKLQLATLENI